MGYKKTVLENGLTILSENVDYVRSISVGVWINVGSRNENAENNGLAHFVEHMLFKGTISRNKYEIAHFLESIGGAINAFTGKEITCFFTRSLSDNLPQSIDLLADIIQNSTFPLNEIKKEKKVILEEISHTNNNPDEYIFEKFIENLFPRHSLGHSVAGNKKSVVKFQKKSCSNFIKKFYIPQRIIITVSGFVNHDDLVKYVKKYFNFKFGKTDERKFMQIPEIRKKNNIYNWATGQQTHICTGVRTFPYNDNRRLRLLVLNTILSGGMSSRLFQNIREKYGIGYDIHSFINFFHDTGFLGIYAATTPKNSKKCLKLIKSEIQNIVEKPVTKTELSTTKVQLKSSLVIGLESTTARMNRLAREYIYINNIMQIDDVIREIEEIEPKHIQKLAQELFQPERFVTTILKKKI
ncbi:MAG: insulinase family protein [Candidatus Cloacimonetes bacterium]|nr:insulinase family protein [Candidatus Cloacimonadota bacterium]MBL7108430.1 insulinase family protein [Candidatus Cloacimonadota bacterium]